MERFVSLCVCLLLLASCGPDFGPDRAVAATPSNTSPSNAAPSGGSSSTFVVPRNLPWTSCTAQLVAMENWYPPTVAPYAPDGFGDVAFHSQLFKQQFPNYLDPPSEPQIPPSLDIIHVWVWLQDNVWYFFVLMAGPDLRTLTQPGMCRAQVGIHIDSSWDHTTDRILTTTMNPAYGYIVTPDFDPGQVYLMPSLIIESNWVLLSAPAWLIGEQFTWSAFAGYSPKDGAYFTTPIPGMCSLPIVDSARADLPLGYTSSNLRLFRPGSCQNIGDWNLKCGPNLGYQKTSVPGTSKLGARLASVICSNTQYELWCIEDNWFATRIVDGAKNGWIGRCPFSYGDNRQEPYLEQDQYGQDNFFSMRHTVFDAPPGDWDQDGKVDQMEYLWNASTDEYTVWNRDFPSYPVDANAVPLWEDRRRWTVPYVDPDNVPKKLPWPTSPP